MSQSDPATNTSRRDLRVSLMIGLCCFVIYNANGRGITAGDTYPARYLPFAIVQHQSVFLNPVAKVAAQGRGTGAFWMLPMPGGRILSLYPIVTPLLVAPLYVPAVAYLNAAGWTDARFDFVARLMEKLSASLLAALSAALLYLLLRRRTSSANALLLTLAYALGTTTWVVSSQALWQHGVAQVLIVAAMLVLTGPFSVRRAVFVALLCGLIACNRPPDVILAAALGLYALFWAGRRYAVLLAAVSVLPMLLVLFYNVRYGGNLAGGYGAIGGMHFFRHPLLPGMAGLLFSPARGLCVYSPFLLFLVTAFRFFPKSLEEKRLTLLLGAGVVLQIMLYAKVDWRGGLSWGPRYLTDLLPLLIWMLVPVVERLRGAARVAFVSATVVAIAIEAIGAFSYSGWVDNALYALDRNPREPGRMEATWKWRNASFYAALKHGITPPELWRGTRGSFDALESGGHRVTAVDAGQEVAATGWGLIGNRSPYQVALTIDGRGALGTTAITDRPDVRAALDVTSPSGWRIPIDTSNLAPGEHQVTAMIWASPQSEARFLADQTLIIRGSPADATASTGDGDLRDAFTSAAARIREHQQADGYWLTSYTTATRFETPAAEVNTFLTSLLVDLLEPVSAKAGLDATLVRARSHLTNQIEPGGLVRYHGRPDSAWIGTQGCAITPDTDDTALVWRIAPGRDRRQLDAALATIGRYRTGDGLYRSWLAPREAYQCLDPGKDPNPTDIAIQLHLLLLLAKERPAEGRALCNSLRPALGDDRIWVYYELTPLVPMLRESDLRNAGCALELPESRTRTSVPGQAIWLSVARLLEASVADPILTRAVLRELARDDFALVRTNPPLVYHNDLTATVPRYYWSADVGFALWLRLYDDYEQR
ncbi:MAG TPA: hypothetical protein VEU30_11340 [Thermoanaerobaculia bacterium]|nr:hypothetical protein [Thermoanaerobaculia bacterium]